MYIPNPRYPPPSSLIVPPLGVSLPYLPRVVGAALKTRRGGRQEKVIKRARRKECGKGGRREGARGKEDNDEARERLAGGVSGTGEQTTDSDGRVGQADLDGRVGRAGHSTGIPK